MAEETEKSFTFFPTYEKILNMLPDEHEQNDFIRLLVSLGIHGVDPEPEDTMAYRMFEVGVRPTMLASLKRSASGRAGGRKGGLATGPCKARPGNRNAART